MNSHTTTVSPETITGSDFLRTYGNQTGVELVRGRVVRYPMPGVEHGYVLNNASYLITDHVKRHDLGQVMSADTFIRTDSTDHTYRGADVCFISYARLPKSEGRPKGPFESPPELVIEVKSPTDRLRKLGEKAYEYLAAGVRVVLVLDPDTGSVAVFREDELPIRLHNGDELTIPDVLPGFTVTVKKSFE